MRVVVIGGGCWGSVFAALLAGRGHDVTLACRDPDQAREIRETGRNPRYLTGVDLSGVSAVALPEAPLATAELIVLAVPSREFSSVAAGHPGPVSRTPIPRPGVGQRGTHICPRCQKNGAGV